MQKANKKFIATSAALMIFCVFPATAQSVIFGGSDCGQWFKNKEISSTWLLGYLSGINAAISKGHDPLEKLNSAEQAFLWMDNYCRNNPLQTVQIGANKLYKELHLKK